MSTFPPAFLACCIRRLSELHQDAYHPKTRKKRCYYDHANEAEKSPCKNLHMSFDVKKGTGYFGRAIWCEY